MDKRQTDEFISTRAAGKMLGISISSATRYFDKGILRGKKHPITHRRHISRQSVLTLMRKYGMKVGT